MKNYTIISGETFANPHFKYEELRLSKMSFNQKSKLNNEWTHKTNINLVEVLID